MNKIQITHLYFHNKPNQFNEFMVLVNWLCTVKIYLDTYNTLLAIISNQDDIIKN